MPIRIDKAVSAYQEVRSQDDGILMDQTKP